MTTAPEPQESAPRAAGWSGRIRVLAAWCCSAVGRVGGLLVVIALARVTIDDDLVRGVVLLVSATGLSANVATAVAEATFHADDEGRAIPMFGRGWAALSLVAGLLVGIASHSVLFGGTTVFVVAMQAPIAALRATYLMRGDLVRVYLPPLARDIVLLIGIFLAIKVEEGAPATAVILTAACVGVVLHYVVSGGRGDIVLRGATKVSSDATTMLVGQALLVACPFVDRFVLARFDGAGAVATFEFGDRVGYLMQVVVWGGIMSELLRRWRSLGAEGDPARVQRELKQLFLVALGFSVLSVGALAVVGRWLTVTMYGSYVDVDAVHRIMMIATGSAGFVISATLATRAILAQGRSSVVALVYSGLFVANLVGDLLVVGRFGATGVAAVTATCQVVAAVVALRLAATGARAAARVVAETAGDGVDPRLPTT